MQRKTRPESFLSYCVLRSPAKQALKRYLPGAGVNRDHEGGSPRASLNLCTLIEMTSAISSNVGNGRIISIAGIAYALTPYKKQALNYGRLFKSK